MLTQIAVFQFSQLAPKALLNVFIVCFIVTCTQAPLLSQENAKMDLAAVELTKAEFMQFSATTGWDKTLKLLSHPKIYITKVVGKRGKTPSKFSVNVTKPGWLLMLQVGHELSKDEYKGSGLSGDVTFSPPKALEKQGWQALGSANLDRHPMILYRKQVKVGENIDFPVQPNGGPFLITSQNPEFMKELSALSVIPAEQALVGGGGAAQPTAIAGQPTVSPNSGGGLIGSLLGMARNFTGAPGAQQTPGQTPASPKVDERSMFIQLVDLKEVKCPIERKSAKRDFHIEYREGLLFFHTQEAAETFVENTKKNSAPANYQLFLTGQAEQVKCPLTGRDMDQEYKLEVGKQKSVAFASSSTLRKLQNKEASYKLKKIFGDTAFKRGFSIKIPKIVPSALKPDEEIQKKAVELRKSEDKRNKRDRERGERKRFFRNRD